MSARHHASQRARLLAQSVIRHARTLSADQRLKSKPSSELLYVARNLFIGEYTWFIYLKAMVIV